MTSSNGSIFRVTGHLCGEFTGQRTVTWSFDVFFDLPLNIWLSEHSWGWWFETLSRPLWRHCNEEYTHFTDSITWMLISWSRKKSGNQRFRRPCQSWPSSCQYRPVFHQTRNVMNRWLLRQNDVWCINYAFITLCVCRVNTDILTGYCGLGTRTRGVNGCFP